MKLKDIIERLDYDKKKEYWGIDELCDQFNIIGNEISDYSKFANKINTIPIIQWYCTDRYVGGEILLFDNEPFCYTWQSARKSDIKYFFFNKELTRKCREFILSLIFVEEFDIDNMINESVLDEEIGDGFKISYSSQSMDSHCTYNGIRCKIIKKYRGMEEIEKWDYIIIEYENSNIEVPISDVVFDFWNLKS